ncbi:MAG: sulfur carrier protein ThiS [Pelagibacteraceae bacterium]|jgi:sulfur carrier protein|nr:sulfur carrier protein ThiS [Pelagibacteraceae bacterium]
MIEIQLNGKPYSLSEGVNIDSLLEELSIPKGKVAIELNRKVLHKENYTKTVLKNNDQVEIVTFIGGG